MPQLVKAGRALEIRHVLAIIISHAEKSHVIAVAIPGAVSPVRLEAALKPSSPFPQG